MKIDEISIDTRKKAMRKDAIAFIKNRLEEVKEGRGNRKTKIQEIRYYIAGQMSVLMLLGTTYGQLRNGLYQLRNEVNGLARDIAIKEDPEENIKALIEKYKKELGE